MEKLSQAVESRFKGTIRLSQIRNGIFEKLGSWLLGFKEKGVTRWWNDLDVHHSKIDPALILKLLRSKKLESIGMSAQVAGTFRGCMTANQRLELHSLRNEDYYELQMRVADNPPTYKRMEELSGGAQVSLLLTLLLSGENNSPLVIDQPEDELDKEYLRETVLPALRNLKGRRQVILATHDANIVVNGDADQVIYLTATHNHAMIAEQDAIENRKVKSAIIDLLDGGSRAFKLRKEKYGF
jgi:predicted ATP-dependent endonuclease of OLD family